MDLGPDLAFTRTGHIEKIHRLYAQELYVDQINKAQPPIIVHDATATAFNRTESFLIQDIQSANVTDGTLTNGTHEYTKSESYLQIFSRQFTEILHENLEEIVEAPAEIVHIDGGWNIGPDPFSFEEKRTKLDDYLTTNTIVVNSLQLFASNQNVFVKYRLANGTTFESLEPWQIIKVRFIENDKVEYVIQSSSETDRFNVDLDDLESVSLVGYPVKLKDGCLVDYLTLNCIAETPTHTQCFKLYIYCGYQMSLVAMQKWGPDLARALFRRFTQNYNIREDNQIDFHPLYHYISTLAEDQCLTILSRMMVEIPQYADGSRAAIPLQELRAMVRWFLIEPNENFRSNNDYTFNYDPTFNYIITDERTIPYKDNANQYDIDENYNLVQITKYNAEDELDRHYAFTEKPFIMKIKSPNKQIWMDFGKAKTQIAKGTYTVLNYEKVNNALVIINTEQKQMGPHTITEGEETCSRYYTNSSEIATTDYGSCAYHTHIRQSSDNLPNYFCTKIGLAKFTVQNPWKYLSIDTNIGTGYKQPVHVKMLSGVHDGMKQLQNITVTEPLDLNQGASIPSEFINADNSVVNKTYLENAIAQGSAGKLIMPLNIYNNTDILANITRDETTKHTQMLLTGTSTNDSSSIILAQSGRYGGGIGYEGDHNGVISPDAPVDHLVLFNMSGEGNSRAITAWNRHDSTTWSFKIINCPDIGSDSGITNIWNHTLNNRLKIDVMDHGCFVYPNLNNAFGPQLQFTVDDICSTNTPTSDNSLVTKKYVDDNDDSKLMENRLWMTNYINENMARTEVWDSYIEGLGVGTSRAYLGRNGLTTDYNQGLKNMDADIQIKYLDGLLNEPKNYFGGGLYKEDILGIQVWAVRVRNKEATNERAFIRCSYNYLTKYNDI